MLGHELIREYYACFNQRRFRTPPSSSEDAVVEHAATGQRLLGGAGYVRRRDVGAAFPTPGSDRACRTAGDTICEVDLLGTGTHLGVFDLAPPDSSSHGCPRGLPLGRCSKFGSDASPTRPEVDLHELMKQLSRTEPASRPPPGVTRQSAASTNERSRSAIDAQPSSFSVRTRSVRRISIARVTPRAAAGRQAVGARPADETRRAEASAWRCPRRGGCRRRRALPSSLSPRRPLPAARGSTAPRRPAGALRGWTR